MFGLKVKGLVQKEQLNNFKQSFRPVLWTDNYHLRCIARMFDCLPGVAVITCATGKISNNKNTEKVFLEKPSITITYSSEAYELITRLFYKITVEVQEVFGPNLCIFDYSIRYHADPIVMEDLGNVVMPAVSLEFDNNISFHPDVTIKDLRPRYESTIPTLFELIYNRMLEEVGSSLSIFDFYMNSCPFEDFSAVKDLHTEQSIGFLSKAVCKKQIVSMYSAEDIKEVYAYVSRKTTYEKTCLGLALGTQRTSIFRVRNTDVYFIVAHRQNRPTVDYIGCFFCNLETELIRMFEKHLRNIGLRLKEPTELSISGDFGTYFGLSYEKEESL